MAEQWEWFRPRGGPGALRLLGRDADCAVRAPGDGVQRSQPAARIALLSDKLWSVSPFTSRSRARLEAALARDDCGRRLHAADRSDALDSAALSGRTAARSDLQPRDPHGAADLSLAPCSSRVCDRPPAPPLDPQERLGPGRHGGRGVLRALPCGTVLFLRIHAFAAVAQLVLRRRPDVVVRRPPWRLALPVLEPEPGPAQLARPGAGAPVLFPLGPARTRLG